jgi:mannose-6-phosphate isomerase-like protein (cupin superfamily)
MTSSEQYSINLDIKYKPKELVDVPAIMAATTVDWFNQTLCQVNESVVRVGIVKGEFHWHKHDHDDEFFFVVDGALYVDWDDESLLLKPGQGITIPRGTVHRTRATERTTMLMIENADISPTGD